MLDFDERDLLDLVERSGFVEVHLSYEAGISPGRPGDGAPRWETMLRSAPNPLAPTLEEAMAGALTPREAERFAAHLRPLAARAEQTSRDAVAYLRAIK